MPDSPPERATLYIVRYSWPVERGAEVRAAYPRHRADLDRLGDGGGLWMIGTLPEVSGRTSAIAIFRAKESAEDFRRNDPLFTAGLVSGTAVLPWKPITFAP